MLNQWEDMETPLLFTLSMVWEVFLKDFQELVPLMVELSCWTLILIKFFSKTERLLELKMEMVLLIAQLLFVILHMLLNVD